jgi:hypothetical protein
MWSTIGSILAPAAGNIIGGLIGAGGQVYANQQTAKSVAGANEMSRRIAREQMQFQEGMSNTAYQRAVRDMRRAGVNPLLAISKGGASTPAGAGFSAQSMRYGDPVAAGISSAKISADIGLTENQAVKIAEETEAVMQTMEFQKVLHSERWSRLFATMGPENVAASAMAVLNNVNIEHVLRGFGANSSTNLKRFLEDVQAFQSRMAKEAKGVVSLVDTLRLYFEKEAEK